MALRIKANQLQDFFGLIQFFLTTLNHILAMTNIITSVFVFIDDFMKIYQKDCSNKFIKITNNQRNRAGNLSISEIMTILICYHFSHFRTFKHYYLYCIGIQYKNLFPSLVSHNRIVRLMPKILLPLSLILHLLKGEKNGIYFIDSTKLQICHNKRISSNKVFKGLAKIGKSSYGWFLGFKLHLIINYQGQIIAVKITQGNVDDRAPVRGLSKDLTGSIYGDKGYISGNLFLRLFDQGLKLIHGVKNNMKNRLMMLIDKILLRKRSLIESVFNILKNQMNLEHSRHRSPINFMVNIISCLTAYCFRNNKKSVSKVSKKMREDSGELGWLVA